MKSLVIFVATAIVGQVSATPSSRHSIGYSEYDPDHSIVISDYDPSIYPSWWQLSGKNLEPRPNQPFGPYEAIEITHGTSENINQEGRSEITRKKRPGYGRPGGWRPPYPPGYTALDPSSTTDKETSNQHGNKTMIQIMMCITACPVTSEFNPVCGTNNVTYANPGRLQCEQLCGIVVGLLAESAWGSTTPLPVILPPSSNVQTLLCSGLKGNVTREITGLRDIISLSLGDERSGELDVQLSRLTACSVPTTPEVHPSHEVIACVRKCPITTEYNPVCGSNNVTYSNHGRLLCEQACGVPVKLKKRAPCTKFEPSPSRPITPEDQISCMRSCPVTGEYNPVCGSNNVTYSNHGRLECAQFCGFEVRLSKMGACGGPELGTTTEQVLTGDGFAAACIRSCPVTSEYNPVCGSNNVTYTNPGRLECAQYCGIAVTVIRRTACEAPLPELDGNIKVTTESNLRPTTYTTSRPYVNGNGNSNEENNGNKPNNGNSNNNNGATSPEQHNGYENGINEQDNDNENNDNGDAKGHPGGWNGNHGNYKCNDDGNRKPPSLKQVMSCMQMCSLTSESNPVCGSDFITYMNPGRLLCAQFCGVDVQVKKFAPCNSNFLTNVYCPMTCTNPPATMRPDPVVPISPSVEDCMEACQSSTAYSPVCGSNNIIYTNLDRLQCAKRCGIDVTMKRIGHCLAEIPPVLKDNATLTLECVRGCSVHPKYEPVCGSDNVTYNNTEHLKCAKQCGRNVEIAQSHPCSTVRPPTSVTTEKVPNPGVNGTFIDPDILAQIWGTTTPKDEDEDFELDHRVQDKQ